MRKTKIPRFYIGLLIFVLLVVILSAIGNRMLTKVLSAYEAAQPQTAAEALLDALAKENENSALYRALSDSLSPYETLENKAAFLRAHLLLQDLELKSVTAGVNAAEVRYALQSGGQKIAVLRLARDEVGGDYGFAGYHLQSAAFDGALLQTVSVSLPVGYTLLCNGRQVGGENASAETTEDATARFMPAGVPAVRRATYSISSLCASPILSAFSEKGQPSQIMATDEDGVYTAALAYDEDLEREYAAYAIEATKAYAAYMQNDRGFGAVRPYFDPQSELYDQLRTSATMWVIDHNGYSFSDEAATAFVSYGEGVFSCRVSLTHTLTYPRLKDYHDYIDMTWYFRLVDGKYLIYNSFNNN